MRFPISYNLEALNKLTNEQLENVYNEKTTPTLEMVLKKLGRNKPKKKKSKEEK